METEYDGTVVNFITQTNGSGLWSNTAKDSIRVIALDLGIHSNTFGGLDIFFHPEDWNTQEEGLIYTDDLWLSTLREGLQGLGFTKNATNDIHYSEQGMQASNAVNCDVGRVFIQEWREKRKLV